jgi:CBS domain-containing protein
LAGDYDHGPYTTLLHVTASLRPDTIPAADPLIKPGRRLLAVNPETDAFTALTVMRRNEVRHLPVVVGDLCVGLLTEGDLLRALATSASAGELTAGGLCHRPAPAVPAGSSLRDIAAIMIADGSDAALVVSRGVMVGLVTSGDVLGAVTARWRG